MDDKRLAHIEYESLYKEIDKHSDRLYLIISFDILAVTTLLGLVPSLTPEVIHAFGSEFSTRSLFFLLPLVILLPSFVLVAAALNSTARIAAYIHVFYEKRTSGISWQHAMQCMREIDKKAERLQYLGQSLRLLLKKEKKENQPGSWGKA